MCGVNLIIDKTGKLGQDPILKMNQALHHRGPDEQGFVHCDLDGASVYVGNTHLQVRDLSSDSKQPVQSSTAIFSYNGEVYDIEGEPLINDTPELFKMLSEEGIECLEKVNGTYSFVFVERSLNKIWIARDPAGVKPLFYYQNENLLIVSSEIPAIVASGLITPKLREDVSEYLQFKHLTRPYTAFDKIFEVEPGSVIELTEWQESQIKPFQRDQSQQDLAAIWEKALQNQLTSQKPVGLFLSGGVDSTLILATLSHLGHRGFQTFSISNDPGEVSRINKVSETFESQHTNYDITPSENDWTGFIDALSQPVGDSGAFLTYLLASKTKDKITIALSGAGADELFAGYNRHQAFYYYLKYKRLFESDYFQYAARIMGNIYGEEKSRLLNKLRTDVDPDPGATYSNFVSLQHGRNLNIKTFNEALEYDRRHYLVSDVLAISDWMTMAHGMELRVPYLDQAMIQYSGSLEAEVLISKGRKWMLKEMLIHYGAEKFAGGSKKGFGISLDEFESLPIRDFLLSESVIQRLNGYVGSEYLDLVFEDRRALGAPLLWSLIILAHWLDRKIRK